MVKNYLRFRRCIQFVWAALSNANLPGFVTGRIYSGKFKSLCLPGLNCYSCPGSLGSCPIGSLQAVLGSSAHRFSFYMLGFFLVIGTLLGRLVCGFLCPFGLVQELLNKIPFPLKIKTFAGDRKLRYIKYAVLLVFVILLPITITDAVGGGSPWFCKLLCPAGTLEGGIPLLLSNPMLRKSAGFLFLFKAVILIITLIGSIIICRPFCKYVCPLGAIYALFNKVSVYRYHIDKNTCTDCGKCENICPMNIKPQTETNHPECIRCGACKSTCPLSAVSSGFKIGGDSQCSGCRQH